MQEREKLDIKLKRGHSAESSTLLLSALRPRLCGVGIRSGGNHCGNLLRVAINFRNLKLSRIASSFAALFLTTITTLAAQNLNIIDASAASLTMDLPASGITLAVDPNSNGGYAKSTAGSVSVKTDAPWGYNLTIKGKSTDTSLTNTTSTSSKLTSITGNLTEDQFKAGTSNTWGYLPSKVDGGDNTTFRPGPSTTPTTIDKTSAKNDTANNYSIILGAKVDNTIPSGAYTNSFTLTSVANSVGYNITYDLNSGSWSGTSPQTGSTVNSSITLDSHTPTKSNYTFKGWCTSSNITNNNTTTAPTCAGGGTRYDVGGTYNLSNSSNTVTMYAMWQQNGTSYSISYNCNGGSPCPSTQSGVSTSGNVTLSSTTPSKSGYIFYGWCSRSPSSNNTSSVSCSGSTYQPYGYYYLSSGASVTMYAMWQPSCTGTIPASPNATFGGKRWTTTPVLCTWSGANQVCPSGYHLPSQSEFQSLINSVGSGRQLWSAGWNDPLNQFGGSYGRYWSSTQDSSGGHYTLYVRSSNAYIPNYDGSRAYVRCVSS